jgi:hypothetical protein
MSNPEGDLMEAMLARLAQYAPEAEVERMKVEFRGLYGGTAVYIKKARGGYRIKADPDSTKCKLK